MVPELAVHVFTLSQHVPLPVFTGIGSVIEEIVAPIPSQAIMLLAGSLARADYAGFWQLILMAFTGAIGKTLGCLVYYVFADKIEDVVVPRFGKYIGISHEQLERVGKKLGRGWRDDVGLFLLRLIPAVPSAPVSVACGLFKIDLKTFILTTLAASFLRNLLYVLIGYYGWGAYRRFVHSLLQYRWYFIAFAVALCAAAGVWAYRRWKRKTAV